MRNIVFLSALMVLQHFVYAQEVNDSIIYHQNQRILQLLESSKISTQIFLGYRYYVEGNGNFNEFSVKRGYINFEKSLNKYLSGRITPDLTIDKEGDGEGDLEMRLKYCYVELKDEGSYGVFTSPKLLIGEVPTPFIDFEEKVNAYRVVASQYLDDMKILTSADFGVTTSVLLGGKVDEGYQKTVSNAYPGKFGSIALGVFNGGGYHALEFNNNKTFQWRLSVRPMPERLPGLQFSYAGAHGKGNTALYPDWDTHTGFLSYESRRLVLTGQLFRSLGNHEGTLADSLGNSYKAKGLNAFLEVKFLKNRFSLFGAYGVMRYTDYTGTDIEKTREIIGLAYHIYKKNKFVIDLNRSISNGKCKGVIEFMFELAL
ncbi:hypothetical protein [Tenuifilum osseticum]|uniref:hypothetical protein n=1 Tax=Tenuifilum osseticum TaxID=3374723 RepID=UPI0034E5DC59